MSSDKVILGTFNKIAEWEGGVVEINNHSQKIVYRRIENGKEIEDSVREYNGYNWVKPSNDQPKEQ